MSGAFWMMFALLLPLLLAPFCLTRSLQTVAYAVAPWAALPALVLALAAATVELQLPAALLGLHLRLDAVARTFLLFTAVIGLFAGWSMRVVFAADPRRFRFAAFYLAGLTGNLGVVLAHDVASFYTFFALMTFVVYGFVIHRRDAAAYRSGRIYIVLVVLGEGMLLAGLLLVVAAGGASLSDAPAAVAASPHRGWIIGLLLGGFGVKVGLLPLHVALPLAYIAVPVPGAVLLAGAMIKAGVLGWLRLLPFGEAALPEWGGVLAIAGLTAIFYGVAVGLTQTHPRSMLAYSSISQMGFITAVLGLALASPAVWPPALSAVLIYATHHALVKSALFLGLDVAASAAHRIRAVAALTLPALMLAGIPFTSGAIAKLHVKSAVRLAEQPWSDAVFMLLPVGAFGTALLMARFLYVVWRMPVEPTHRAAPLALIWTVALFASLLLVWLVPDVESKMLAHHWHTASELWSETWPVLAAALIAVAAIRFRPDVGSRALIPPGDILVQAERLSRSLARAWRELVDAARRAKPGPIGAARGPLISPAAFARWHGQLQYWPVAGMLFLLVVAALLLLFIVF